MGKGDEEARFGKGAASLNSQLILKWALKLRLVLQQA